MNLNCLLNSQPYTPSPYHYSLEASRLKLGSLPSGSVCQAQSSLVAEGGSAVRVGGPRTRAGKKGAESEAEVLVPSQEDRRISLTKTTECTSRAGGLAPTGVQGGLPRFDKGRNSLVLYRRTHHSLHRTFTDMLSFLSDVLRNPMGVQNGEIEKVLTTGGGPCTVLRDLKNKTRYPHPTDKIGLERAKVMLETMQQS